MQLFIARSIFEELLAHLRRALPEEGCGLLATIPGTTGDRTVVRFYPGENIDHSDVRYTMDPRQVIASLEEIERKRWELGVIAHSHPSTPAEPSRTDRREAFYPGVWQMIVSFARREPNVAVWSISRDQAAEPDESISLVITGDRA